MSKWEVADLITSHGRSFLKAYPQNLQVIKTLMAIKDCRTPAMGGHKQMCSDCGHEHYKFHSCRNRHCPKCQGTNREKWIWHRELELLPVPYFHIVFTIPDLLNDIALHYPKELYNSLFKCAWQTIKEFSSDHKHLGAQTGMTAVMHTWGQNMSMHPHLHCIVPGGGITHNGKWKTARNKGKYLFPSKAMAKVFRAKIVKEIRDSGIIISQDIAKKLFDKQWVVYAKQPFMKPKYVIEYLGRYTHKIAISNNRIKNIQKDGTVSFTWKDYRKAGKKDVMHLSAHEFLRRFSQHILPSGFVRIRHYGILASRNKIIKLNQARTYFKMPQWKVPEAITWSQIAIERMKSSPIQCPVCKKGVMVVVEVILPKRAPPVDTIKPNISFYAA